MASASVDGHYVCCVRVYDNYLNSCSVKFKSSVFLAAFCNRRTGGKEL